MVAKPSDLPEWASGLSADIVNPTGAKKLLGWLTAEKPPAQHFNWWMNNVYAWATWLQTFEDEAHVWSKHQSFNEGITASRTLANNHAVTATGNGTGVGVFARGGASGVGVRGEGFGASAPGLDGYGDLTGGSGGAGVRGNAGTNNAGVLGNGNGSGPGTSGIGGGASGIGAQGVGGDPSGIGVHGTGGAPNGVGVRGVGTGTGRGAEGVGGSSDGIGVKGTGGATNGIGVQAEGTGNGTALNAIGGSNGAALVAKTSAGNDTATIPAMVLDSLDSNNRHRFHLDHLGMPGGRILHVSETWQAEQVFQGNAGGEQVPDTLMWYHDTTGGNKGTVLIGTPNILMTDATNDQGVRFAQNLFSGDTGEYSQLFTSQQVAAKANTLYIWEWEVFIDDYAGDNEFRIGLIDPSAQYITGHTDHDPTTRDRILLTGRTSVNSGKFLIEWVKGGMADAAVDSGVLPSGYTRIRIEVVTSGVASANRSTIYLNGQKVYSKNAVLDIPVGLSVSVEGKVMGGGGAVYLSPIDLFVARYAAGATAL